MKSQITKMTLLALVLTSPILAQDVDNTYSLVGIEGGYSSVDVSKSQSSNANNNLPSAGFKIGAQTDEYRVFASIRYFSGSDFDYITTYGAELQYMIDISQSMNFYFGGDIGVANMKFSPSGADKYRTVSDTYFGGDVGLNMHLTPSSDLEIGVRYIDIGSSNTINNVEYTFNSILSGYVSYIYKFKMD